MLIHEKKHSWINLSHIFPICQKKDLLALAESIFSAKFCVKVYVTHLWYKMFWYTVMRKWTRCRTLITSAAGAGARCNVEMESCYCKSNWSVAEATEECGHVVNPTDTLIHEKWDKSLFTLSILRLQPPGVFLSIKDTNYSTLFTVSFI